MLLEVKDFLNIRQACLETDANHAIIAGRNGCGKSHLIEAIVEEYGLSHPPRVPPDDGSRHATVVYEPAPERIIYHPPQRYVDNLCLHGLADSARPYPCAAPDDYLAFGPPNRVWRALRSRPVYSQVTDGFDGRSFLERLFSGGGLLERLFSGGDAEARRRHECFRDAFEGLTGKILLVPDGPGDDLDVAWQAPGEPTRRSFSLLSSGEKHIALLLLTVAACGPGTLLLIDEVERHLHPSLQARLVSELVDLLPEEAFILATTHAASLLVSTDCRSLWWMDDAQTSAGGNQLRRIGGDAALTTRIFDLYAGCSTAKQVPEILVMAYKQEFGAFLDQCYEIPEADDRRAHGLRNPQIDKVSTVFQGVLATSPGVVSLVDFGCGEGRCLAALDAFEPQDRGRVDVTLVDPDEARLKAALTAVKDHKGLAGLHSGTDTNAIVAADYVVAVNVFHEIVGHSFVEEFTRLWEKLKPDGLLHILELGCLPRGEMGFLMISPMGYRAFFRTLGIEAVTPKTEVRGPVEFNTVLVKRGGGPADHLVRPAYIAALRATRADCLRELKSTVNQDIRRAFWLENLTSVDMTLEEMGAADGPT